jgi:cyclopropane fatty-acyl-phospholipid synthase-like methyltransferase
LEGPGIWKWRHYFPVYERHFQRFRGQAVRVLEIGIYSGGSLGMWVSYFGSRCQIIGVDIEPSCRVYETEQIQIEIGDQSDRNFWRSFRERIPPVDIIIDDGGHLPKQQRVTLEELLTHLNPGGVYLCEDITGTTNPYHAYLEGAARTLHSTNWSGDRILANAFQNRVASIHQYPFVCVIEVAQSPSVSFHTDRRGTQWQPFFRHQRAA